MSTNEAENLLQKGIEALNNGHSYLAMSCLEQALTYGKYPKLSSYLGYCLALNGRDLDEAIALGYEALETEPNSPAFCLNLGRTLLLADRREDAIRIFRQGLTAARNGALVTELEKLGIRKSAVFPGLARDHFLNKYCGMVLSRLGLR